MPEVQRPPGGDAGERGGPPAGQEEKPPADRPVDAGEPEKGPKAGRRVAVDPVARRGVRDGAVRR
jgi:hypothetical protein